jgi:uncharacterized protein YjiS (DUF1127 family)
VGWLVWIALLVGVAAAFAALVRAIREALAAWRSYKRFRRHLGRGLYDLEVSAARVADNAAKAGSSPEPDRSVARLRESIARLNVLRRSIGDVTDAVGSVTAVYPRK